MKSEVKSEDLKTINIKKTVGQRTPQCFGQQVNISISTDLKASLNMEMHRMKKSRKDYEGLS